MPQKVPFGFSDISPLEKTARVRALFSRIAPHYDLMNDLMSGGLHRAWKHSFVQQIKLSPRMHCLDVAGGTGDIAFRLLKAQPTLRVTLCDLNPDMLGVGKKRAFLLAPLQWVCGDAAALPFTENSMDVYTISFGLRNVTDISGALTEAYRVLKPGGQFHCLEFSQVQNLLLKKLYDLYSFSIIPKLGQWVAQDHAAYQYLVESIARFPDQQTLASILEKAGFSRVRWQNLSAGIAAIHSAWKI